MVWTSGVWVVKPGREAEFTEAWHEFATWSLAAFPGGRAWLLRDRDRPNTFLSVGPWPDESTIARCRASDGFGERVGRIRDLLDSFEARVLDEAAIVE